MSNTDTLNSTVWLWTDTQPTLTRCEAGETTIIYDTHSNRSTPLNAQTKNLKVVWSGGAPSQEHGPWDLVVDVVGLHGSKLIVDGLASLVCVGRAEDIR